MSVTFDVVIKKEYIGTGDGSDTTFFVSLNPVESSSETVYVDGSALSPLDYTLNTSFGLITFDTAPADGAIITVDYIWDVALELELNSLSSVKKSKKKVIAIPYRKHILIPLGSEGPTYTIEGMITGESTFTKFNDIDPEMYLKVISSTYPEFAVGDHWMVDTPKITRKGGMCDVWIFTATIIKEWYM